MIKYPAKCYQSDYLSFIYRKYFKNTDALTCLQKYEFIRLCVRSASYSFKPVGGHPVGLINLQ